MRVALVYDRVNKWGGAERVLLALHKLFPNAPLYTSVYNKKTASWVQDLIVKSSFLQKIPFTFSHELLAPLMPMAFESFSFDEYDLVISVTSEAAKGIITQPHTVHVCYCLTPTRYLWSGYDEYFKNHFLRFISKPIVTYFKKWDIVASQRPDVYIAISEEVRGRIKKYYNRDSIVVYPPVSISHPEFISMLKQVQHDKKKDYFLVVSRLVPYKRIDIAIEACNQLNLPLKIIGSGSEEYYLKSIAGPTIEFLGNLTDEDVSGYYMSCKALIFPGIEDFGLTILEAQSFGKPVIAFKAGGALETIIDNKTGMFFYPQDKLALVKVLEEFKNRTFDENNSLNQAEKFNRKKFNREFLKAIDKILKEKK